MEVHQHAHNTHGKKTWKSYFWEFLMLFLAVFCGFLAEYQLEHVIEHKREKQFIHSFIEDLKSDTASINGTLNFRNLKMKQMDSLIHLLRSDSIQGNENELYFFGRSLVRSSWFQSNDRTITQLKNSGALRLIRNKQAADSIMTYQKLVDRIEQNQEDDRTERYNAFPIISKMFDPFVFDQMVTTTGINKPLSNPPLRSYDKDLQLDLAYCVHQLKGSNFLIEARLILLKEKAEKTIAFLKREYHLK